ncbi:nucleotidyltransferase domain-containing protein [Streptomyces ficellus]|uniref:Nucleotidyltransferase n=1 Tax=Streptomyces ficellus TaxID=1977088 RepID=A0A6I6FH61_9ACTN|nr:nucleotidyltransferase domain-containing protein [Streptomyces ficellus]QGV76898.1 nucleotidyltransferase [Streptomyces ficellus]
MTDEATHQLLDRFLHMLRPGLPLLSVWAHGSLAGGDYQPGRSDLDLIAVLERPCTGEEEQSLRESHEGLGRLANPLVPKLHCSYAAAAELGDPARPHVTWAHEELMRRPITPVTRRELHDFGRVLYGEPPKALLPPVPDGQLTGYIVENFADYWRPRLDRPELWTENSWVDLGLLVLARATVTLRDGRLITKAEALDVLLEMGAPAEVVADVRRRRYDTSAADTSEQWLARRAELTLAFLRPAIDRIVARAG